MVKRFLKYAMMLMAVVSFATFSSCGDDDDEPESTDDLVGTWVYVDEIEDGDVECGAFQFYSNGRGTEGIWNTTKKKFTAGMDSFTWNTSASGRILIDYGDDLWTPNYYIEGKYLYMWDDDEPIGQDVLKKVQ